MIIFNLSHKLWKATHCIYPTLKSQAVSDFLVCSSCQNIMSFKIAWIAGDEREHTASCGAPRAVMLRLMWTL